MTIVGCDKAHFHKKQESFSCILNDDNRLLMFIKENPNISDQILNESIQDFIVGGYLFLRDVGSLWMLGPLEETHATRWSSRIQTREVYG